MPASMVRPRPNGNVEQTRRNYMVPGASPLVGFRTTPRALKLDPTQRLCYAQPNAGGTSLTRIPIDPDTIRALAAVLVETGLTEIEIADKDNRIRVVRGGVATTVMPVAAAPVAAIAAPVAQDAATHPGAVVSPMVGVAYLSPEPGAPAFVNIGQQVAAGQTLLLIEAMKTFNQIKAPKSGTVTAILVQSGAPVEYGEALIVLG
jgi:acetyl-CoA carboxylase biotin carboxyl carrier protein